MQSITSVNPPPNRTGIAVDESLSVGREEEPGQKELFGFTVLADSDAVGVCDLDGNCR